MIQVTKKNGAVEPWNFDKIAVAVRKSAKRVDAVISAGQMVQLEGAVTNHLGDRTIIDVQDLHGIVEVSLNEVVPEVAMSYMNYRNYRKDIVEVWEDIYQKTKDVLYLGDRENANFNSALISTKGSLVRGHLTKDLFKRFYLSAEENQIVESGELYIHDLRDLIFNGFNCIDENGWITIRKNGEVKQIQLKELDGILEVGRGLHDVYDSGVFVLSRTGWARLKGVMSRNVSIDEGVYEVRTKNGIGFKATAKHRVPVVRDGDEIVVDASEIMTGDSLLRIPQSTELASDFSTIDIMAEVEKHPRADRVYVKNLDALKRYMSYKYGLSFKQLFERFGMTGSVKNYYRNLRLKEFRVIRDNFEIPFDVLSTLNLGIAGSQYNMPVMIQNSPELGKVFGYVFSDGCVHVADGSYQTTFSSTNKALTDDFVASVKSVMPEQNVSVHLPTAKSTTPCTNSVVSNAVFAMFLGVYKQNSKQIKVPDFITHGAENIQYAFIGAAYDGDGTFAPDGTCGYATICRSYAEQMAMMLTALGYNPVTRLDVKPSGIGENEISVVRLNRADECRRFVGQLSSHKANRDFNFREGRGIEFENSVVTKVTRRDESTVVYDLQTSDHWFIVNGYVVHNCCLFDMTAVLKGGFEMSGVKYKEPKSILAALQVIGDVTLVATAQQYGGFTISEIDRVLVPYVRKSLERLHHEALYFNITNAKQYVNEKICEEIKQGFQSLEMKLNTVPSSRGDTAFVTISFGNCDVPEDADIQRLICSAILRTRMTGQGNGSPVVFPKLVYLHSAKQHEEQGQADLFDLAIECSSKAMYPDYLSLDHGYVGDMYAKTGKAISPMGCRAYLSDFQDEAGESYFVGRANIGAVSLNLPMIWKKSEGINFWTDLDYYLEVARQFHIKRYEAIANNVCSTNPLAFTQGGIRGGNKHPNDPVGMDIVKSFTASFGITSLNELNVLMTGEELHESDRRLVNIVVDYIDQRVQQFKREDGFLYALYATPAESLAGTQMKQFRKRYGVIPGVSDREYFSNGFHCHVGASITPFQKQDYEFELFHKINGGHIQYVRLDDPLNLAAVKTIVKRGMAMGFYQGVNFQLTVCENCGYRPTTEVDICPECGSHDITVTSRVCGYLGTFKSGGNTRFNDSKLAEVRDRVSM